MELIYETQVPSDQRNLQMLRNGASSDYSAEQRTKQRIVDMLGQVTVGIIVSSLLIDSLIGC